MKIIPLIIINLSENIKEEWLMKEEGSYTDNNKPLDHVYRLIADSPKNKIVCNTKEQVSTLLSSAIYQTTWNSNDPEVIKLEKSADRIVKQLRKLNLY